MIWRVGLSCFRWPTMLQTWKWILSIKLSVNPRPLKSLVASGAELEQVKSQVVHP
jgi:hypothetical protein